MSSSGADVVERARAPSLPSELLRELAREHGTPLYVYDFDRVRERISELRDFDVVRYAIKANSNLSLLRRMRSEGVVVDAVSAGEICRALAAGFDARDIVYTADLFDGESLALIAERGLRVNVGSIDMLPQLAAARPGAATTLRVNPGFGAGFAPGVSCGGADSKHGVWHGELGRALALAADLGLIVDGLHVHVGSGIDVDAARRTATTLEELGRQCGQGLRFLSAGGGLPVPYRPEEPRPDLRAYAAIWLGVARRLARGLGHALTLETEPGRYLVAEAGVLLTELRAKKLVDGREFWLVDAGFHTLARPMLYGAWHAIEVLGAAPDAERRERVVAGPLCEPSDVLTPRAGRPAGRLLPPGEIGDILCVFDVGAYGASMASTYNSRPLPAEVLVEEGRARLVRRRQGIDELLAQELEAGGARLASTKPEPRAAEEP